MSDDPLAIVAIVAAGIGAALVALWIGWKALSAVWLGALILLVVASARGIVGLVAYAACWLFLFPFMLAVSLIVGALGLMVEAQERREEKLVALGGRLIGR